MLGLHPNQLFRQAYPYNTLKKNYSAIAKIAMFFVGAIVTGIPANAILQPKIIEREAEIELIKLESKTEI